jgi:hypothetical protein
MGYSLEFYSLPWATLRDELVMRRAAVIDEARLKEGLEPFSGKTVQAALEWRSALDNVSAIMRAHAAGSATPVELSDHQTLAVAVMVRYLGSLLGSLDHASASGKAFRDEFLGGVAAKCFREPSLCEYLTERPFLGVISNQYPSWGGLSLQELARMAGDYQPPTAGGEDALVWSEELFDLLAAAQDCRADLVTLYL